MFSPGKLVIEGKEHYKVSESQNTTFASLVRSDEEFSLWKDAGLKIAISDPSSPSDLTLEAEAIVKYLDVENTSAYSSYATLYEQGHGKEWIARTIILLIDGKPAGFWQIACGSNSEGSFSFSTNRPVLPPILSEKCGEKIGKKFTLACLRFAGALAKEFGQSSWISEESRLSADGFSDWHIKSIGEASHVEVRHELCVDLSLTTEAIWTTIRHSFKSLIREAESHWQVDLHSEISQSSWDEVKQLHMQVSGRQTRSDDTWEKNRAEINSGRAFAITLRSTEGTLVGGALFNHTKDEGTYSTGVYDRTMFDKPIGHIAQWRAIQEFKKRGVRWYKIGIRPVPSDYPSPSLKEISIGHFKSGFATHIFPRYVITHQVQSAFAGDNIEEP